MNRLAAFALYAVHEVCTPQRLAYPFAEFLMKGWRKFNVLPEQATWFTLLLSDILFLRNIFLFLFFSFVNYNLLRCKWYQLTCTFIKCSVSKFTDIYIPETIVAIIIIYVFITLKGLVSFYNPPFFTHLTVWTLPLFQVILIYCMFL